MTFYCPKCNRYGMEWDGRAKVLMCYYNSCNHVIRIENQKQIPSPDEISEAIEKDAERMRVPEIKKEMENIAELRDELWKQFLQSRGVVNPCPRCGGLGRRAYANTTTWRGGIGGQVITGDVCDLCWGTGDKEIKGTDLKMMLYRFNQLENENKQLRECIEQLCHKIGEPGLDGIKTSHKAREFVKKQLENNNGT